MSSKRLVSVRAFLFVAVLTLLVPAFFYVVSASAQSSAAKPVAAVAEEESAPLKNDASHQGIKVHGHWKIVVRNPDGSIAEIREFDNSLTPTGAILIAAILSGSEVSGGHAIFLETTGTSICGKTACGIVPGSVSTGPFAYTCLNGSNTLPTACVNGMTEANSGGAIALAGQLTASQTGTITTVMTYVCACVASVTATACPTSNPNNFSFTSATLPSAISVTSGQVVQVSVTLSFA
jgi:hypothetical protein